MELVTVDHPRIDSAADSGTAAPPAVGAEAPDFAWSVDGTPARLRQLRGHPVLLAFFSQEWDPARPQQLQAYNQALRHLGGEGTVIGLAREGVWCDISLEGREHWHVPVLSDLGTESDTAKRYGVCGSEALFVLDATGRVVWRHVCAPGAPVVLDDLLDALRPTFETRPLSRREFLLASLAVSMAAVAFPRIAAAQAEPQQAGSSAGNDARSVVLNVNGQDRRLSLEARVTLLDALRERLGLTGTKKGCDHGQCGACTVHIDGRRVNACLTLAMQAEGTRITTIEGLSSGAELHPVQAAFVKHDGFQCGYCTSGQIMSAVACIAEGHAGNAADVAEWMSGNICRCGAYPGIRAAILDAAGKRTS